MKIPAAIIGLLSQIFPEYYSHAELDALFLMASAPAEVPAGNKSVKVTAWLRAANKECSNPIEVLGALLESFMDGQPVRYYGVDAPEKEERERLHKETKKKIEQTLAEDGFVYSRGGYISKGGSIPTISLQERVSAQGFTAIEVEVKRALSNVEKDPLSAVHNAGAALESTLKAYLEHYGLIYNETTDTLSSLWNKVVVHIGISPKEMGDKDLKQIASGLFSIVQGTMHLRNKKSASHGKSETQFKNNTIRSRHARLAIHSSHTLCVYILELLESE